MTGKEKCRMLREIRRRIASENDIPFVTEDCKFQGNCRGTCPKCESELRELERQLRVRESMGKRVTVAALCAGMAFTAAGCTAADLLPFGNRPEPEFELEGDVPYEATCTPEPEPEILDGESGWPDTPEDDTIVGEILPPDDLMGLLGPGDYFNDINDFDI